MYDYAKGSEGTFTVGVPCESPNPTVISQAFAWHAHGAQVITKMLSDPNLGDKCMGIVNDLMHVSGDMIHAYNMNFSLGDKQTVVARFYRLLNAAEELLTTSQKGAEIDFDWGGDHGSRPGPLYLTRSDPTSPTPPGPTIPYQALPYPAQPHQTQHSLDKMYP